MGALCLERWRNLDVQRYSHEPLPGRIWQLCDTVSACDAAYVALAQALRTVLCWRLRRSADIRRTAFES